MVTGCLETVISSHLPEKCHNEAHVLSASWQGMLLFNMKVHYRHYKIPLFAKADVCRNTSVLKYVTKR
jgi:hypothetical protein